MGWAGILLVGVLAVAAVLVITAVLTALAPYLAVFIIVCLVVRWATRDEPRIPESRSNLPTIPPLRE